MILSSLIRVLGGVSLLVAGMNASPTPALGRAAVEAPSTHAVHLRLVKSEPAKDDSVSIVVAVKLWFSLQPALPLTRIRLKTASGTEVPLGAPKADSTDQKIIVASTTGAVLPGRYTVSWKTASGDGHPITGDFSFVVTGK